MEIRERRMSPEAERWPIAVGDQVHVFLGGRKDSTLGTVTAVGPKLVQIDHYGKVTKYLRSTRNRQDGNPGYFRTLQQHDEWTRLNEAIVKLRERGLELVNGSYTLWSVVDVEKLLAAVTEIRGGAS
jgi:hypothetical protein